MGIVGRTWYNLYSMFLQMWWAALEADCQREVSSPPAVHLLLSCPNTSACAVLLCGLLTF